VIFSGFITDHPFPYFFLENAKYHRYFMIVGILIIFPLCLSLLCVIMAQENKRIHSFMFGSALEVYFRRAPPYQSADLEKYIFA
jgi:hypothetical protein